MYAEQICHPIIAEYVPKGRGRKSHPLLYQVVIGSFGVAKGVHGSLN
jgi:hypothetical protein